MKSNRITLTLLVSMVITLCSIVIAGQKEDSLPHILSPEKESSRFLPDFSYVGYRWGEKEIPQQESNLDVIDFGAVPDDGKDDTEALKKALAAAHKIEGNVVLSLPPGRFIVKDILYIQRSDF